MVIDRRSEHREVVRPLRLEAFSELDLMPGVRWGRPDVLFTPAYWRHQAEINAENPRVLCHRLGTSLKSECVACLLGGHGIPAEVGIAAFMAIKDAGLIDQRNVSHETIHRVLSTPLKLPNGRAVRYRFAKQKSLCVFELLRSFEEPPPGSCVETRDWLTGFRGIGLKTASWIVRNWFGSDEVAILDIHIHRAGILAGVFDSKLSITRDYLALERQFLDFAAAVGVRASILDALIWQQMKKAGSLVHRLLAC